MAAAPRLYVALGQRSVPHGSAQQNDFHFITGTRSLKVFSCRDDGRQEVAGMFHAKPLKFI